MASRLAVGKPPPQKLPATNNDIDDYDVDDDPFADSGPEDAAAAPQSNAPSKKRKEASGLGIDEEVAVAKKVRAPAVKLDETRLLSEKGIPRLRRKARDLKFKGKGHEFSDAARLLSFYQLWLDDLFPKAKFLDALAMVEKTGHKKYMHAKRMEWIDEGKPKPPRDDDDEDIFGESNQPEERDAAKFPARVAPIFQNATGDRPKTPALDDLFGDEDLYGATPRASRTAAPTNDSLFGGNGSSAQPDDVPDEDDLDALMAEEEAQRQAPPPTTSTSIFGGGSASRSLQPPDEDDLDALMAEAEAQTNLPPKQDSGGGSKPNPPAGADDEDDLDALMAEAEAESLPKNPPQQAPSAEGKATEGPVADADEEEAMAEMDGLW